MDILKQRKERFAKPVKGGYGLPSRGEDNRLQLSASARNELFIQLQTQTSTEALYNLRKLREATLNMPCNETILKYYTYSMRLSVTAGHWQTLLPVLQYLLKVELLDRLVYKEVRTYYALYLSHIVARYEDAICVAYSIGDVSTIEYIKALFSGNYHIWFTKFQAEKDPGKLRLLSEARGKMIKQCKTSLDLSYFQLSVDWFQKYGLNYEEMKYTSDEHGVVIIRQRGGKKK